MSVFFLFSPSSEGGSTLLGLDKNTVDFGSIILGTVELPIWTKLKIRNYSNEDLTVSLCEKFGS